MKYPPNGATVVKMKLPRLNGTSFDWQSWRSGSIADFNIPCRKKAIIASGYILRRYAIGWCEAEYLVCRPKRNQVAVKFLKDENEFWFHIRKDEFQEVFGNYI